MAKARDIEGFAEAGSFAEAAALAVETRTDELFSFSEGVLDTSDIERVQLLPAGVLILEAISDCLGMPLKVAGGGLREGVIIELAAAGG